MGKLINIKGRKIQFVTLNPIDSNSDIIKVELGIDAKTKHIYKLIQTGSNGAKTSFTITSFKSNQPYVINTKTRTIVFVCNGEIYNYRELDNKYNLDIGSSDCLVITKLFIKILWNFLRIIQQ